MGTSYTIGPGFGTGLGGYPMKIILIEKYKLPLCVHIVNESKNVSRIYSNLSEGNNDPFAEASM